jgi:RNA polymerase sigma-70 factor (ECF subfamily)
MQDTSFDRALMERVRAGDKAACAECIERHSPDVYRVALRLAHDEAEAEDIVQDTFLQAFKAIDTFDERSNIMTWLYRIAYNVFLMRRRQDRGSYLSIEESLEEDNALPVPEQLFDWCCLPERDFQDSEVREELEQAISELPESLRAVFVLRELEALSTQECAATLQISPDVVKQRLHRARLWLRERLSTYFTERARG